MWRTPDRVMHSVALPSDRPELSRLIAHLEALTAESREQLERELFELQWNIADELDTEPIDLSTEAQFSELRVPIELVDTLSWERLLGPEMRIEFSKIDLRWRIDVLSLPLQALADLDQ